MRRIAPRRGALQKRLRMRSSWRADGPGRRRIKQANIQCPRNPMNIGSSLLDIGYSIALSKFRISPPADALGLIPSKSLSVSQSGSVSLSPSGSLSFLSLSLSFDPDFDSDSDSPRAQLKTQNFFPCWIWIFALSRMNRGLPPPLGPSFPGVDFPLPGHYTCRAIHEADRHNHRP